MFESADLFALLYVVVAALFYGFLIAAARPDPLSERQSA